MRDPSLKNPAYLSLTDQQLSEIDELADRFDRELMKGDAPRIETFLAEAPEAARDGLLAELLVIEWEYRTRKGDEPQQYEYFRRFPERHGVIAYVFARETTMIGHANGAHTARDEVPLGFLAPATRPDSLGRIGHYEVLQVLGQGGFGIVFRAFDDVLHRVVAVKVLSPPMAATSPARKRFLREARSSAQVRHENVVQVYEVGETPLPYIAMEFIPGETLQDRLNRIGPVEPAEVVRVGRQIAEGLAAAHGQDLIHRDIKPGNILLEGEAERVKITDFGLARAADDASITQSGIIAGTPMYMAPEQAKGERLDRRADLFSLGSVLYQMVSGRSPFRANGTVAVLKRVAEETPREIREIIPETPQWLCDIISKLHAKNPDDRYQSAREVADVLANCETQLQANAKLKDFSLIPSGKPTPHASRRWKWAATVVLLPVIVLAVTELAGVTHLFRGQQATTDPTKSDGGPTPIPVAKQQQPQRPTFKNSIGMEFVAVPKGTGWLGGGNGKPGETKVEFKEDFFLGKYEVTQEEWEKVMGSNPSNFSRNGVDKDAVKDIPDALLKRFPVENVSWEDCQLFIEKLNAMEKGWVYRLPKQVEWEYACRGGSVDNLDSAFDFYFVTPTNKLRPEQANFNEAWERTCKVGSFEPNSLGLYDMHGNLWEWCEDLVTRADGVSSRVIRGGSWTDISMDLRTSARRYSFPPSYLQKNLGLRLARVPSGDPPPALEDVLKMTGSSWEGSLKVKDGPDWYCKVTLEGEGKIYVKWHKDESKLFEGKTDHHQKDPTKQVVGNFVDKNDGTVVRLVWISLDELQVEWWPNAAEQAGKTQHMPAHAKGRIKLLKK